jgi:hypothetical protein
MGMMKYEAILWHTDLDGCGAGIFDRCCTVMRRHERASTLLTSNRPVEDWGKTARRQRGRHRHARPPATPRSHPEMRAKELAYENRLAGPGENGLKESRPGPHSLAAFDLTTEAYDNNGISNPNDGRLNPLLFLLIHEGEFTALLPKEKTE